MPNIRLVVAILACISMPFAAYPEVADNSTQVSSEGGTEHQFLQGLAVGKVEVTVYLEHGTKLQGTVDSFDQNVIIFILNNTVSQMVYKHAISTIVPARQ